MGLVPVLEVAQRGLQLSGIGAMIHSLLGITPICVWNSSTTFVHSMVLVAFMTWKQRMQWLSTPQFIISPKVDISSVVIVSTVNMFVTLWSNGSVLWQSEKWHKGGCNAPRSLICLIRGWGPLYIHLPLPLQWPWQNLSPLLMLWSKSFSRLTIRNSIKMCRVSWSLPQHLLLQLLPFSGRKFKWWSFKLLHLWLNSSTLVST